MLSARQLIHDLQNGVLTPTALADNCLQVIEEKNGDVGAFVNFDADKFRASIESGSDGPLAGIPVGIKDIIDTAEFPTEHLSPIYEGHRPKADANIVSMVKRAGGAVAAKTVTTEFAFFHAGKTRNPHNLEYSPGGSSSGSAAAIAAGFLPLAIGTQTGGSIIRPASFCGVSGYKPSFGLLPKQGTKTFSWTLDTLGLFAASAAENAFFMSALTGRDLQVMTPEKAPTIGFYRGFLWDDADEEMQAAVLTTAQNAENAGAKLVDIDFDLVLFAVLEAHQTIQDYEACRALAWELDFHRDKLSDRLIETLETGLKISSDDYDRALFTAHSARHHVEEKLSTVDAIITPSAPGIAPHSLSSTGNSIFNRIWTLMGVPCVSVPGFTYNDMPLSAQVITGFGQDQKALSIAHWLEKQIA